MLTVKRAKELAATGDKEVVFWDSEEGREIIDYHALLAFKMFPNKLLMEMYIAEMLPETGVEQYDVYEAKVMQRALEYFEIFEALEEVADSEEGGGDE